MTSYAELRCKTNFSFLTGAQAFNIRSTDSWWKLCIQMLLQSCEIIVVDVSKVKQGTDWELNQIRAKSLLSKSIFVVSEDAAEQAGPILERYFDAAEMPPISAFSSTAASALDCESAEKTGLRTSLKRSGLSASMASNLSRSALTASTDFSSRASSNRAVA